MSWRKRDTVNLLFLTIITLILEVIVYSNTPVIIKCLAIVIAFLIVLSINNIKKIYKKGDR